MLESESNFTSMIRDYRWRVDETVDNIDENFRKGDIQYCIRMITMMIKIGRHIGDEETVDFLKELMITVMSDNIEDV